MSRPKKTLERVLTGTADANITFLEMCGLLLSLGFTERVRGSHHIFTHEAVAEILNLQSKGAKAKPYQVKQVREIIVAYGFVVNDDIIDFEVEPSDE
ncbi:MAG: type II toxin-antitoxin system HicA family toxin [Bacteroidales bacterium]|nr:type II toxin-antitoxin system HicA family toxin [Bacteroidales bacterium]